MRTARLVPVLFCFLLFFTALNCQAEEWIEIGKTSVKRITEREVLEIGAVKGAFKQLKIKVEGGTVEFKDVTVVFEGGRRYDLPVRSIIRSGGETRAFNLPGDARKINRIVFLYKTRPTAKEQATVTVLGNQ